MGEHKKPAGQKTELKELREIVDSLKKQVKKHNDILQCQDNWHSKTSKLLGKKVGIDLSNDVSVEAKLLWTDRYHIGVENDTGEELIVNKGHLIYMKEISKEV